MRDIKYIYAKNQPIVIIQKAIAVIINTKLTIGK